MAQTVFPSFTTLSIKLARTNFMFWRTQILSTIRAHGFDEFLSTTADSVPKELVDECPNPVYTAWIRNDQLLLSWILASISDSMLGHVSRSSHSFEVWQTLENLFRTQSKARIMNLRFQLQTLKKGDKSIEEYVLQMRGIADMIQAAGQEIKDDDLILHILGGLGPENESIVVHLSARGEVKEID